MGDFSVEISVEKDGKIITLDADDMDINIYQEINGEQVRTFEIRCCNGVGGPMTIAEFVGKKNYEKIDVKTSPDKVVVYSERGQ